jgi:hypothetical protein
MLAVVVVEDLAQVELLVLVAVEKVKTMEAHLLLELLIQVAVVAVVTIVALQLVEKQAVLALSSLRPINNEDKWKPKSIGCMESTPQCIY